MQDSPLDHLVTDAPMSRQCCAICGVQDDTSNVIILSGIHFPARLDRSRSLRFFPM
jgi:hypothetical protein